MHMFEWPSVEFWKQKNCEKLALNLFWEIWIFRVQHLDYRSYCLFVASPKCWYCSGSHILHIQSSKSIQKQIPWKSARWIQAERNLRGLSGKSGFPVYSGPGPETPGCKGINTFDHGEKAPFILLQFNRAPLSPRRLPSSPSMPLGDFLFPPAKSSVIEGLKAPRCGNQGSTQDSKDSSLLPSLPKVCSKELFPDLLP
jgi:hypothetical protein